MKPARGAAAPPSFYDDARARLQAEREATREVTRELHEQVQAAKDAARDLRQAQEEACSWATGLRDDLRQSLADQANGYIGVISEHLEAGRSSAQDLVDQVREGIQGMQSRFITGVDDQQAMIKAVVTALMDLVIPVLHDEEFTERVSRRILTQLEAEAAAGSEGTMTKIHRRQAADVFVRVAKPGEQPGLYEGYRP